MTIFNKNTLGASRAKNRGYVGSERFIYSEFRFPDNNVTLNDLIIMFDSDTLNNLTVTGWEVFMDRVDLGTSTLTLKETTTATIAVGSPAVVTWNSHGLMNNSPVVIQVGNGTLPGGLSYNTTYYAVGITANTFNLALTPGGEAINATGSPVGTLKLQGQGFVNVGAVAFNVGCGDDSGISGTQGYRWATNTDRLGRSATMSMLRHEDGAHFARNGGGQIVGLQVTALPANAAWAGKRIVMALRVMPTGMM